MQTRRTDGYGPGTISFVELTGRILGDLRPNVQTRATPIIAPPPPPPACFTAGADAGAGAAGRVPGSGLPAWVARRARGLRNPPHARARVHASTRPRAGRDVCRIQRCGRRIMLRSTRGGTIARRPPFPLFPPVSRGVGPLRPAALARRRDASDLSTTTTKTTKYDTRADGNGPARTADGDDAPRRVGGADDCLLRLDYMATTMATTVTTLTPRFERLHRPRHVRRGAAGVRRVPVAARRQGPPGGRAARRAVRRGVDAGARAAVEAAGGGGWRTCRRPRFS